MTIRYIVGHGWAERVSDVTALPHRVLRINYAGDIDVRRSHAGEESAPLLQISHAEIRFLARESRRAERARLWARLFGRRSSTDTAATFEKVATAGQTTPPDLDALASAGVPPIRREQVEEARAIRRLFEPMKREDGTLDVSKVAMESTMRTQSGLPSYIAELDGPGKVQ
ncbi:hypothetical protein SEA_FUZZBUSTER_57 [Microbacterium phage FuzzBuster]|uniref:Uncharacterized protein n=1 Tax=Microbacterium phage FuzzBuster TaxID=2590935 RepID=A0A516KV34_9CAUD|nr:hypothetical protein SEA_FUZZBUSTER_57 [Microbacterium phage FuzzBuster]